MLFNCQSVKTPVNFSDKIFILQSHINKLI